MIIKQILNNNVVISSRDDKEIIVVGKGIGFNGKVNEEIDEAKVEKTFVLQNQNNIDGSMMNLLEAIPYEIVKFGIKATDYILRCSHKKISDRILIPLIDHIYSCLQRYEQGVSFDNTLAPNVSFLYHDEYKIATDVVDMLNSDFNTEVDRGEATFITLHIVNAQMDTDIEDVYKTTDIVNTSVKTVEEYFNVSLSSSDLNFIRFITHLQFFAKRMVKNTMLDEDLDLDMNKHINVKYANEYACAKLIGEKIQGKYGYQIEPNEYTYLTIHIARLLR